MTVTAKYEDGVFKPLQNVALAEGAVVELRISSSANGLKRSPAIVDFAFFGMWKDRTDIGDSVEYVNKLRRNLRG